MSKLVKFFKAQQARGDTSLTQARNNKLILDDTDDTAQTSIVLQQLVHQDTPPIDTEEEGHTTIRYLTALCAAWLLLKYAGTLPGNAASTRNKWALTILVLACNIQIVDAATVQNISNMILQNAAQIKILDCFTAYQQRQHLGGLRQRRRSRDLTPRQFSGHLRTHQGRHHTAD